MSERGWLLNGLLIALCLGVLASGTRVSAASEAGLHYAPIGRIQGPSNVIGWDYATVDAARDRLYLATLQSGVIGRRVGAITAFDLKVGTVLPTVISDEMPHKVVILEHGGARVLIAAADAVSNSIDFFDGTTGRLLGRVPTGKPPHRDGWHNPDSMFRDPASGLLIAVNHDSGALALVDVARRKVVGRVHIGGILEEVTAADDGTAFVNVASQAQIAVVRLSTRRVVRRISLRSCEEPTGIAYDSADGLVISVCSNGWAKFVDPASGRELASIGVGKGADGVMYDANRKVVLIAAGESGTLSVIRLLSRHSISLVQTLRIPRGARLGAVDVLSGRLYLPSAKYDLNGTPLRLPGLPPIPQAVPGSFGLLVFAPISAGR